MKNSVENPDKFSALTARERWALSRKHPFPMWTIVYGGGFALILRIALEWLHKVH